MRTALERAIHQEPHPALLAERYAKLDLTTGALPDSEKLDLVSLLSRTTVPQVYSEAFGRWRALVSKRSWTAEIVTRARLVVGIGNPSALEIGISLHHTYGVPYLPGTTLKGVLNHWLAERLGNAPESGEWMGVAYEGGRPVAPPGKDHGFVFGVPEVDQDRPGAQGNVRFDDAWLIPSEAGALVGDVLTPHQFSYYRTEGADPPTDWDDPQPHPFVTVPPGTSFLIALDGPGLWPRYVLRHLLDALDEQGIGAKTVAGYGRLILRGNIVPPANLTEANQEKLRERERAEEAALREEHEEREARAAKERADREQEEERLRVEEQEIILRQRQQLALQNIDFQIGQLQHGNAAQAVPTLLSQIPEHARQAVARRIIEKLTRKWLRAKKEKTWVQDLLEVADEQL